MPNERDRALHVAGVLLEGELRRVDADDRQPGVAVARVPRLEVGQRADAVDARVGPEVDQHDAAAQRRRATAACELNQRCVPVKSGAVPSTGSFGAPAWRAARSRELRRAAQMRRAACRRPCESSSPAARFALGAVLGDRLLGSERRAGATIATAVEEHHGAERALHGRACAATEAPAAPPSVSDEQHDRRARRVGERDEQRRSVVPVVAPTEIDGGEDRARARRVDEPQRRADREPGRRSRRRRPWPEARQPRERRLDPRGEPTAPRAPRRTRAARRSRRRAATESPRPDAADDLGQPDDRERERHREPEHDPERPAAPARRARRTAARAGRAARTGSARCRPRRRTRRSAADPREPIVRGEVPIRLSCHEDRTENQAQVLAR